MSFVQQVVLCERRWNQYSSRQRVMHSIGSIESRCLPPCTVRAVTAGEVTPLAARKNREVGRGVYFLRSGASMRIKTSDPVAVTSIIVFALLNLYELVCT